MPRISISCSSKISKVSIFLCLYVLSSVSSVFSHSSEGRTHVLHRSKRYVDSDGETENQFQSILSQARTEDGLDPNAIIQNNMRDPVPIADFNVSSSGLFTDIKGHFTDVQLHGLKNFQVKRINVNLARMNLSAVMFVPSLKIGGNYALDGTFTFVPISGNGGFWMNLTGISINGDSVFHATENGGLEMGDIKLTSKVEDINLHFENLMGGGAWSRISNSLLNQLSELILDELKQSLLSELGMFLKSQFNDHLFTNLPSGFVDPKSSNIVDSLLNQAASLTVDQGLDPLEIPDHMRHFEQKLLFVTTSGEYSLTNGQLYGMSSLKRTGDVLAVYANNSVLFEANFGFKNLTATYDWETKVFGVGPSGSLDAQIKSVDGFIRLKQDLRRGSRLELDSFHIKDIQHIWLDVSGLGTWDYVVEIIVNVATNGLKMNLADAITGPLKENIQHQIDTMNIVVT